MAPQGGLEPLTTRLTAERSTELSYCESGGAEGNRTPIFDLARIVHSRYATAPGAWTKKQPGLRLAGRAQSLRLLALLLYAGHVVLEIDRLFFSHILIIHYFVLFCWPYHSASELLMNS